MPLLTLEICGSLSQNSSCADTLSALLLRWEWAPDRSTRWRPEARFIQWITPRSLCSPWRQKERWKQMKLSNTQAIRNWNTCFVSKGVGAAMLGSSKQRLQILMEHQGIALLQRADVCLVEWKHGGVEEFPPHTTLQLFVQLASACLQGKVAWVIANRCRKSSCKCGLNGGAANTWNYTFIVPLIWPWETRRWSSTLLQPL